MYDINNSKLGSFRLLAKLHKPTFSWRPIVNCKDHPNSRICFVIDYILKQIVRKTETYLRDSQNLIQKINNLYFEKEPYLYSLDIVSLYTNINQSHAIDTITEFMSRYIDNFHINIIGFNILLKIMFNSNVFTFDENFFKQICGLPMGCICGPSIANIYVYILEIKWFYIERPLLYVRFIDDTFLALENELNLENFSKYFIYLKFTKSSGKIVNFLDLNIWYDKILNKLETSVYLKPTNNFSYLDINSDHPKHIFKNIPNSILIRDRKICSNYSDFVMVAKKHIEQLEYKGYCKDYLIKLTKTIGNVDRNSLLPYKDKSNNDFILSENKSVLYFHYFNFNLNVKSIIYNAFKSVISKINLIYINRINVNLNNALVHNFKLKKFNSYKTKKCNMKNCKICKFIYASSYIKLDKFSNLKIKLMNNASCTSTDLIYIIICKKCKLFYIGETSQTLKARTSQHLNHIINFKPYLKYEDKEVAKHFRRTSHKLSDFKVCVFKTGLENIKIRKYQELDLINRFNINKIRCMNTFKAKKNKKFVFI